MDTDALGIAEVPPADWIAMNDLVLRYAEAIDTKDWALFRTVFTEDCCMTYGEPWGPLEGLDVLTDFVIHFHEPLEHLRHATTNFRIGAYVGDTARGRCSVEALLVQTGAPGGDTLRVTGVYHDTFVRTGGAWRISRRVFTSFLTEGNPDVGAWDWERPGVS
jgi:3-phenylpropionate/cinnamic acid dioxygenase small subunit